MTGAAKRGSFRQSYSHLLSLLADYRVEIGIVPRVVGATDVLVTRGAGVLPEEVGKPRGTFDPLGGD